PVHLPRRPDAQFTPGGMIPPVTPLVMEGLRPSIASPRENGAKTAPPPARWLRLRPGGCGRKALLEPQRLCGGTAGRRERDNQCIKTRSIQNGCGFPFLVKRLRPRGVGEPARGAVGAQPETVS